jgi:hypothetical protein
MWRFPLDYVNVGKIRTWYKIFFEIPPSSSVPTSCAQNAAGVGNPFLPAPTYLGTSHSRSRQTHVASEIRFCNPRPRLGHPSRNRAKYCTTHTPDLPTNLTAHSSLVTTRARCTVHNARQRQTTAKSQRGGLPCGDTRKRRRSPRKRPDPRFPRPRPSSAAARNKPHPRSRREPASCAPRGP